MTVLVIICIIVLLFIFLFNVKIRAEIKYRGGVADIKVRYLFFTIFPFKEKPEKIKKQKPKKKKDGPGQIPESDNAAENAPENSAQEIGDNQGNMGSDDKADDSDSKKRKKDKPKEKKTLSERLDGIGDIIEKAKIIWGFSQKGLKRLFTHIRIDSLVIDFSIAGEDAYSTALNYGRICAVTYNAVGFIQAFFRTSVKSVDIVCDFNGKRSVYDCEAKITITPSTILSAVFIILFGLLRNLRKLKGKTKTKNQPDSQKAVTV